MESKKYAVTVHYKDSNTEGTYTFRVIADGWEDSKLKARDKFDNWVKSNREQGYYEFKNVNIITVRPKFLHYV